ncbi:MAG TPA: serine/threonine-protein kinase [Polyangia bacterium]|jgi:serine/threonine-protein kinase
MPEVVDTSFLAPGTRVGEYEITGKLGEGGMGVVYAGMHPEIGKRVAIKVLAPHAAQYPDLIRRFKEEARAVNKIRHPNIIDIFAFNQLPDGRHYFVMEYLDGESLTARLERGSMEFLEMRRLLGQICSALQAAHQASVVHRDLKPDNIWVATENLTESRIKLLDFGIAKLNDLTNASTTQAGVPMGTPHYMPPEQGMGRAIDARADIYALGVILYQLFAGALPFDGVTAHEVVLKHVTELPPPPSRHRPIRPPEMEAIILACLEKEPSRRPSSVKELWASIDAAFANAEAVARPSAVKAVPRLPGAHTVAPPTFSPPQPQPPTTLRGTVGEVHALPDGDDFRTPRRRTGRTIGMVVAGGAALAAVAFFATSGRHGAAGTMPGARPESAPTIATPAATGPAPVPAATTPPSAPEAPKPAPPIAPAAPTAETPPAPAAKPASPIADAKSPGHRSHADHGHRQDHASAMAKIANLAKMADGANAAPAAAPPSPPASKPAAAKPNCSPNFTLDAQGEKHFKPECF